jgi:hypothetical protein
MSTHDVPGHNPINNDKLAAGCWAEHDDGSLVYVLSTEGGAVTFMIFDVGEDPPTKYIDTRPERQFKQTFSWKGDKSSIRWTWHDKTPFPFDRVLGAFKPSEIKTAQDVIKEADRVKRTKRKVSKRSRNATALMKQEDASAARRVAASLKLRGSRLKREDIEHFVDRETTKGGFLNRLKRIFSRFDEP